MQGSSVSTSTVSNLDEKTFAPAGKWRNRPPRRAYPYVYVGSIYLNRSLGRSHGSVAAMTVMGVNDDYREVIGPPRGSRSSTGAGASSRRGPSRTGCGESG